MYIHLGENFILPSKEVVMILDCQSLEDSQIAQEFLSKQSKQSVKLSEMKPKSVVITKGKIYFSPLTSSTLKKRARMSFDADLQTSYSVLK
ncbi:DUF370 domain-containing protein [Bacillus lacus]|uniref:DUF370 domain-containing protein n=1 Tax=Metabacillus lacus TaxID=1983721 RepID=A0A7X2J2P3_9BACI|nr:extracellular matrix/biofilm biosynthesis regulator RemA family protein [Metabacillus lacus]MRX74007.1 DUF370 domain-containing protein [Metabacillus lacus]